MQDKWHWLPNTISGYSVKECYCWINERLRTSTDYSDEVVEACKVWWKNDIPSKVLVLGWRLLWNKLPTREKLHRRGILLSSYETCCVLCFREIESCEHIFCSCSVTQKIWQAVLSWAGVDNRLCCEVLSVYNEIGGLLKGKNAKRVKHLIWAATVWSIWLARSKVIFKGEVANVNAIVASIKHVSWGWFIAKRGRNSGMLYSYWYSSPLGILSVL